MPYFSIIVGIYNVEIFFIRGISQLLKQSFNDFEIILVDDGSTDNSPTLCDEWALKDSRIIVKHKKNGGLGSARNVGLELARGKYIWSFDMDDMIDADVLERLHHFTLNSQAEVLCFGYTEYNKEYNIFSSYEFNPISCTSNEEVRSIYVDNLLGLKFNNGFFWNKLYLREFIENNHLRFGDEYIQQDELFNLKVYRLVNHLELIPGIYYHYIVYKTGNNGSRYIPQRFEIVSSVRNSFLQLYDYWKLNDNRMLEYIYKRYFNGILLVLNYNLFHPDSHLTSSKRKDKISAILNNNLTQDCISQMEILDIVPNDFYSNSYFIAIKKKSIPLFLLFHYINAQLNKIKGLIIRIKYRA